MSDNQMFDMLQDSLVPRMRTMFWLVPSSETLETPGQSWWKIPLSVPRTRR